MYKLSITNICGGKDMEKWEVLDENGIPTGEIVDRTDKKVNKEGFYHLGVDIWIINSDNKFLIQKRSHLKKKEPNVWAMTGGSAMYNETSLEALVRETKEELDIDIFTNLVKKVTRFKTGSVWIDTYVLKYDYDILKMKLQEEEVSEVKWATLEEIDELHQNGEFIKNRLEFVRKFLKDEISEKKEKKKSKNKTIKLLTKKYNKYKIKNI